MRMILEIGKKYPEITGPFSDLFAYDLLRASSQPDITELVLDMNGTRILSSMAMEALLSTYQRLKIENKRTQIINASPRVINLLRMVNMDEIIDAKGAS